MIPGFEQDAKPLIAGVNPKVYPPQLTFFFERADGSIFVVEEEEAWKILSGHNQLVGQQVSKPKLIGVSDGLKYAEAMSEAKELFKTQGLEASQARIRQGFDEELAVARGHIQLPRNFDVVDNAHNPINLTTGFVIPPNHRS